jgi:DNA-directed RNA polymerase I, II, and III subunit RPABC2
LRITVVGLKIKTTTPVEIYIKMEEDYVPEVEEEFEEEAVDTATDTATDPYESLYKYHPETILDYAEAVIAKVPLQSVGGKDKNHMSQPFLTVFEKTKVLGFRTNQLAQGARPYIAVPDHVTDCLDIAKMELEQRRLPFIIKRPMPDGTFEYWRLSDLMML